MPEATDGTAMKVTDRRMFTPEGELREEFRDLEDAPPPTAVAEPRPEAAEDPAPARESRVPMLGDPAPEIADLISMLAQPASIYLRQASMADAASIADNLEMARLHIDLLAVLKEKTAGNLDLHEAAMLDDTLAQLRFAYVDQGG